MSYDHYGNVAPKNMVVGMTWYVADKGRAYVYNGTHWISKEDMIFEEKLSSFDQTMIRFTEISNNGSRIKLVWKGKDNDKTSYKDPNFWAGIAIQCYLAEEIDRSFMTDLLLCLQGWGATADHFKDFLREFTKGAL